MRIVSTATCIGMIVSCVISFFFLTRQNTTVEVCIFGELSNMRPQEIESVMVRYSNRNYFTLNLNQIKKHLEQLPWVAKVELRRSWPHRLVVEVIEEVPLARFENSGVVTVDGKLLHLEISEVSNLDKLPVLVGEKSQLRLLIDTYMTLLESLSPIGLKVVRVQIMPDSSWRAMLEQGVELFLGKSDIRERLYRFSLAYTKELGDKINKISTIDLRYTNGVAVGYKTALEKNT